MITDREFEDKDQEMIGEDRGANRGSEELAEEASTCSGEAYKKEDKKLYDRTAAKKGLSTIAQTFVQQLETVESIEDRIKMCLEFMRNALAQSGSPRFRDFWDVRQHCLGFFKGGMTPTSRAQLWASYLELSVEARRLKEILDEQSAFAVEQIELAVIALEADLLEYAKLIEDVQLLPFAEHSSLIQKRKEIYEELQRELNLLNALAARVNGLRKEVIKTDMRIRTRAKFFNRLSLAGDRIFPRRKELIKRISEEFVLDVAKFVKEQFQEDAQNLQPVYVLREEIKALQGIAKILTLNTHAFNTTRQELSICWDKLKEWDKKKKEEIAQKKQAFKHNVELVKEKILQLNQVVLEEGATLDQAQIEAQAIQEYMRSVELGRDEVRFLKEEIKKTLEPLLSKAQAVEEARKQEEMRIQRDRQEKIDDLLRRFEHLLGEVVTFDFHVIQAQKVGMEQEFAQLAPMKAERLRFDKISRQLREALADKKEKSLLSLSSDDLEALGELRSILKERMESRQEIKQQLEEYRKALGGSGFDFEKAMMYREMIDADKERLVKINDSIAEIEEKIEQIQSQ